jgi:hypothetical protein
MVATSTPPPLPPGWRGASRVGGAHPTAPGVLHYQVLCYAALAPIALVELQRGVLLTSLLVFLVGILGVMARFRVGPFLLILVLAVTHIARQLGFRRAGAALGGTALFQPADVLLCGAVLAYCMAHYRLQSLVLNVFPIDPRRRKGPPGGFLQRGRIVPLKRSPRLVTVTEVGFLLLSLPLWAVAGQALWAVFGRPRTALEMDPYFVRMLVFVWILGLGLLISRALLRTWEFRQLSRQAAGQFVQDVLWRETRREQRRANRWFSWRRLKMDWK